MEKELEGICKDIREKLRCAQEASRASNKPLLIMVGEEHDSPQSAIMSLRITQEAQALGISDVAFENTPSMLFYENRTRAISRMDSGGHTQVFWLAEYLGIRRHAVDLDRPADADEENPYRDRRNKAIAPALTAIGRPTVLLVGASHLKGLLADTSLSQTYEIVSFNVSPPSTELPPEAQTDIPNRITFSSWDQDNTYLNSRELLEYALGPKLGNEFSDWAEAAGHKLSLQKAQEIKDKIPVDHEKFPKKFHYEHCEALNELGETGEALGELKAVMLSNMSSSSSTPQKKHHAR